MSEYTIEELAESQDFDHRTKFVEADNYGIVYKENQELKAKVEKLNKELDLCCGLIKDTHLGEYQRINRIVEEIKEGEE